MCFFSVVSGYNVHPDIIFGLDYSHWNVGAVVVVIVVIGFLMKILLCLSHKHLFSELLCR